MSANPYFLTWQEAYNLLLSYLPPSWRITTGKVLARLLVAFSLSIESLYALLARLLRLSIIATSEGDWLRALVNGFGMTSYGGVAATVNVRFTRYGDTSLSTSIPLGVQVGARYGQLFVTTQAATIPVGASYADVPCVAVEAGLAGNVRSGEIISLVSPIGGIDAVTNPNPAINGFDPESDTEIKSRVPKYLQSLHRGTIPATEYAISVDRVRFPEVQGFVSQRNYGTPGYFRGILSDYSGGNLYRASGWAPIGNAGVYVISTSLTEVNGLVAAGFPCQRFGVVSRQPDGEEIWQASPFVADVEQGNWRYSFDATLGRLYARSDGSDLNNLEITIVSGVVYRAQRELEANWAANGVYLDVIVPFVVQDNVSITYKLEPGYNQLVVEGSLRNGISDFVAALNLGQDLDLENLYAAINLVAGAAGVLVVSPVTNVSVPPDSVFRLANPPTITKLAS